MTGGGTRTSGVRAPDFLKKHDETGTETEPVYQTLYCLKANGIPTRTPEPAPELLCF